MFTEEIELRGHIIDSLILPKVLDEILKEGAEFHILEMKVGRTRTDPSYARIEIAVPSPDRIDPLIRRLRDHGAQMRSDAPAQLLPAPADGVFPADFYITTNHQTFVRLADQWIEVKPVIMDSGIAVDPETQHATAVKFYEVRKGMQIVAGHQGVRVAPAQRATHRPNLFEFMSSQISTEKPKSAMIRQIAAEIELAKRSGGRILVVAGPAVVHTGAGEHLERLIAARYVDLLFAGNALAVHDIEQALYGTALGVHIDQGKPVEEGHANHLRAINAIRAAGGMAQAIATGLLRRGIMYQCIQHQVELVLAGSIRDDGPLPEVITDSVQAQRIMRSKLGQVAIALMLGTMLHSIAVGNLLPATVKTICVDINPAVVTKLTDRGSFQALGLVTDLEPFLRELTSFLDAALSHAQTAPLSA